MDYHEYSSASLQAEAQYALSPRLQSLGRSLLEFPVLNTLRPLARKVIAVTEIPGMPRMHNQPASDKITYCNSVGVISANLWHDWPRFRLLPERLEAFACLVEEKCADILLLQEVTRKPDLCVDEWLGKRLGMDYVYSRANGHSRIGFEEGVAIYSRFPMHSPNILQLGNPGSPFTRRMGVSAQVDTPCGSIHAFSVHLGIQKRENARQISHLQEWVGVSTFNRAAVIGGDFNAHESSSRIKQTSSIWVDTYRQVNPINDASTHALHWPWGGVMMRHRLDYIFLKSEASDWQIAETQHMTTTVLAHSDHRLVYTRLVPDLVNCQSGIAGKKL